MPGKGMAKWLFDWLFVSGNCSKYVCNCPVFNTLSKHTAFPHYVTVVLLHVEQQLLFIFISFLKQVFPRIRVCGTIIYCNSFAGTTNYGSGTTPYQQQALPQPTTYGVPQPTTYGVPQPTTYNVPQPTTYNVPHPTTYNVPQYRYTPGKLQHWYDSLHNRKKINISFCICKMKRYFSCE